MNPYRIVHPLPEPEGPDFARALVWACICTCAVPILVLVFTLVGLGLLGERLAEVCDLAYERYWG